MHFAIKHFAIASLLLLLPACASEEEPTSREPLPPPSVSISNPYRPTPVRVKECTVTKMTPIEDCTLYDLMCDDGEADMVLLCPTRYWEYEPPIPRPIREHNESFQQRENR